MIRKFNIITFENNKIVIIIDNNNNILFNAKQISLALDYKNPKMAIINNVDKDDDIFDDKILSSKILQTK
jgi:prophage antirepressor-like protein